LILYFVPPPFCRSRSILSGSGPVNRKEGSVGVTFGKGMKGRPGGRPSNFTSNNLINKQQGHTRTDCRKKRENTGQKDIQTDEQEEPTPPHLPPIPLTRWYLSTSQAKTQQGGGQGQRGRCTGRETEEQTSPLPPSVTRREKSRDGAKQREQSMEEG